MIKHSEKSVFHFQKTDTEVFLEVGSYQIMQPNFLSVAVRSNTTLHHKGDKFTELYQITKNSRELIYMHCGVDLMVYSEEQIPQFSQRTRSRR